MVNGLVVKKEKYEVVDRDKYIELCTPQMINFDLFKEVFYKYMYKKEECEFLPIADKLLECIISKIDSLRRS